MCTTAAWSTLFSLFFEYSCCKKWNKSGFRPLLWTYRLNWPGESIEDGEMCEMTLPSRHRIRNSQPGGLRPSTLPLGHGSFSQYWILRVEVEKTFIAVVVNMGIIPQRLVNSNVLRGIFRKILLQKRHEKIRRYNVKTRSETTPRSRRDKRLPHD